MVVSDYDAFSEKNLTGNNPIVPSITLLLRYGERDNRLKNRVLNRIAENANLSATFLRYAYRDDDIKDILNLFKDDYDKLAQIYMNALEISDHLECSEKLFIKIFEQRPNIWKEYVDWVKKNSRHDVYEQKIFELIWTTENWQECINYAYSVIVDDDMAFFIEHPARLLFGQAEKESDVVKSRKKQWLLESLHENCKNTSNCKKLIDVVVNVIPYWKLDYILEYLKDNQNVEDFKKINLFPMSALWSGSEVPLIIDKIEFLKRLKEKMKGVSYIEHRAYIDEYRRNLEAYKEKVELKEYLEKADYA